MKIVIINQPLNNRGDESAHKALVRSICNSIPDCRIEVLFVQANKDSIKQFNVNLSNVQYLNLRAFKGFGKCSCWGMIYKVKWLWKLHPTIVHILQVYKKADLIICAPGGICMGGFQDWNHLFYLQLAKYARKPLAYYGRSFGPFPITTKSNRDFKKLSLEMLHYFWFLSIRDSKTEKLAQELGLGYVSTVDSAFLDAPKVILPKEIQQILEGKKYIVFVPNLLIWHYAYKGRISKEMVLSFYSRMTDVIGAHYPDHEIIMLPQTFNYGNYEGDDIHLFNEIKAMKKDYPITVISDQYSSDIQQTIIQGASCLVGARYHSVVFAINNNVPFVALSYEHKISGLLETLGKTECMLDITFALDSEKKTNEFLVLFKEKLNNIKSDSKVQALAKAISNKCFSYFVNQL